MTDRSNSFRKNKSSLPAMENDTPSKTPKERFRALVKWVIYQIRFDQFDPQDCVQLLRDPTPEVLGSLKKKVQKLDEEWTHEFMNYGGLDALLDVVDTMGNRRVSFFEALMLLESVTCIRYLANSAMGLSFLAQNDSYTKKLVTALDTNQSIVKTQVFELLSALCLKSSDGYILTLYALDSYKIKKNQRYRFSVIMDELEKADLVSYRTTLMGFVNCIILANEELQERVRIRNEFIGLNCLGIINDLRKEDDEDMMVQCEVFDKEKASDDEEMATLYRTCIDINNAKEVFNALYHKVYNTPFAEVLLNIMLFLLQSQTEKSPSIKQWKKVEDSVKEAFLRCETQVTRSGNHVSQPPPPPPPVPDPNFRGVASDQENVWKKVGYMEDRIKVNHETLEQLFCSTEDKAIKTRQSKEVAKLKNFDGDTGKLGNAEKFYLKLIQLPGFDTRIKGGYAGNAKGFKIESLNKLIVIKTTDPNVTLLYYLVEEAEKEITDALNFVEKMSIDLDIVSKLSVDELKKEINTMKDNVTVIKEEVEKCPNDVKHQLEIILQAAEKEMGPLYCGIGKITERTKLLVDYFCENGNSFDIDECIDQVKIFCDCVRRCQRENLERKEKEAKRRHSTEHQGEKTKKILEIRDGSRRCNVTAF
ncbi:protein diaphanous-like [Saccostrea echinata]|uniref:protein diaphanous-like n=1 Tax=Saccostrea echinata TaxID=191078 RepID=UPI002A8077B9|nr:protein diaphanous-like [Saccostrea echinata]